jgi:pimeloyl-ACP methyl ester carboxylesterase
MLPVLVKPLDWLSIQFCARSVHRGRHGTVPVEEAEIMLHQTDFFAADIATPDLTFETQHTFRFASPRPSPWPENNVVVGRLYRCLHQPWQECPTVVMLHGWNAELGYQLAFPGLAGKFNRLGFNAAMIELPYHGRRKPRAPDAVKNFLSDDLVHILDGTRQALTDARALISWLERQGCRRFGVWGISLGAWLAGILACHDPRVYAAALSTPVARMDRLVAEVDFCEPIRKRLNGAKVRLDPLNLVAHKPLIPPDRIFIVESAYDLFAPLDTIEELWERWGQTQILRTRHGHISAMMSPFVTRRTIRWLAETTRHPSTPSVVSA